MLKYYKVVFLFFCFFATSLYAAQATLSGTTTNQCAYSGVTVSATGEIVVTCSGTSQPTPKPPVSGCAPVNISTSLAMPTAPSPTAQRYFVSGRLGDIISLPVPSSVRRIRTFETTGTPASNFGTSFVIAKCPGELNTQWLQSGPAPCKKQGGWSGNTLDIVSTASTSPLIQSCYITAEERTKQWYFNIRVDFCPTNTICPFFIQVEY